MSRRNANLNSIEIPQIPDRGATTVPHPEHLSNATAYNQSTTDQTLPTYTIALQESKLSKYQQLVNKVKDRRTVYWFIGAVIFIAIAVGALSTQFKGPPSRNEGQGEILLAHYGWMSFTNGSIGTDSARHLVGYEMFSICAVDSWNGSPALMISGTDGQWVNYLDNNVRITQIAPYNFETLVALSTSRNSTSLNATRIIQLRFGKSSTPYTAAPVASINLTNITTSEFRNPIVDASIHLSQSRPSDLFVAIVDSAMTTWIHRLKLPGFTVESSTPLAPSSGSYYRFAESYGYSDLTSNTTSSGVLMLRSAATTLEESFALLMPSNLTLSFHQGFKYAGNLTTFLGPASRGAISRDGTYITVMGDRTKIAEDIAKNTTHYHRFVVHLGTWETARFRVNETLLDVGTATSIIDSDSSQQWTIEGYESRYDVSVVPFGPTKNLIGISQASVRIESILSSANGFYALGYKGSAVSFGGIKIGRRSTAP
ncbi:hypothetical protein BJ742DRAFT_852331 [Cladochytrium replicatum]|nr:hypothetical protein BJ742DRAFT_852331 [Cladochytrium replicatum]